MHASSAPVVGRKVPEHVDVALHEPEVDPHRVEELQVAEHARLDDLADLHHRRSVAVDIVNLAGVKRNRGGHRADLADPSRFLVRHDLPQTPKPMCSERQHRQWC
jgi:hypothetical protein